MKEKHTYRTLAAAAMFAAMITLTTAYLFHIPIGSNGGYVHFGDTFIYLAASLLPAPYACAAALVGGGLADLMSGAAMWMLPTMIIKPLMALCFTRSGAKLLCMRNMVALGMAGIICVLGYYVAEGLLFGSWVTPIASMPGNAIQAIGSAVLYAISATALERTGVRARLGFGGKA